MTTIEQAGLIREEKIMAHTHYVMPVNNRISKLYPDPNYLNKSVALLGVQDLSDNNRSSLKAFRKHWCNNYPIIGKPELGVIKRAE